MNPSIPNSLASSVFFKSFNAICTRYTSNKYTITAMIVARADSPTKCFNVMPKNTAMTSDKIILFQGTFTPWVLDTISVIAVSVPARCAVAAPVAPYVGVSMV